MRENDLREGRPPTRLHVFTHFLHDLPERVVEESAARQRRQSDTPSGSLPLGRGPASPPGS